MQTQCNLEEFRILHLDEHLVVIHKPAGLLVHRSNIDRRETLFALQLTRDAIGRRVYPVHRLDKATSGLLIMALDPKTAAHLSSQFANREVQKQYLALVRGWPAESSRINKSLVYRADKLAEPDALSDEVLQDACTVFRRIATASISVPMGKYQEQRYALVEVNPETGRKHQIRRHLNHISHPIIGDVSHGDRHHNHLFNRLRGYHRLYLAGTRLRFRHPESGTEMDLSARLQDDFKHTLEALGLPGS